MSAPLTLRALIEGASDSLPEPMVRIADLSILATIKTFDMDPQTAHREITLALLGSLVSASRDDRVTRAWLRGVGMRLLELVAELDAADAPVLAFSAPFQELDKPAPRRRRRRKPRTLRQRMRKAWRKIFGTP